MRRLAQLILALDTRRGEAERLDALRAHFDAVAAEAPADAAWALHLLAGGRLRRVWGAATRQATLRAAAGMASGLPEWLLDACCDATGDLAEAIALLLPPPTRPGNAGLAEWIEQRLPALQALAPAEQPAGLAAAWDELDGPARHLLIQLLGGGARLGVDAALLQRALAAHCGLDATLLAQRLLGWTSARTPPSAARWQALVAPPEVGTPQDGPAPFVADRRLDDAQIQTWLSPPDRWISWAYGGLRAQLLRRGGQTWLWADGGRLLNDRFPEVVAAASAQPDATWPEGAQLDGELLVWPAGAPSPAPADRLQRRLARARPGAALRAATPPRFIAHDLLNAAGKADRPLDWTARRAALEALLAPTSASSPAVLEVAEVLTAEDAAALAALRERARALGVAGLRVGRRDAAPGEAAAFWPLEPQVVQAVLLYAQAGAGGRGMAGGASGQVYTFAVWNRPPADAAEVQAVAEAIDRREPPRPDGLQLLPIAKVTTPADAAQADALARTLRRHTLQKFGPVRALRPVLVAELGFDGVAASARHKSGLALQQPRLLGLREDAPLQTLGDLMALQALARATAPDG